MPYEDDVNELETQVDDEAEQEEVNEVEESQDEDEGDSLESEDVHKDKVRKPFLEVDERTRYMTADDAKRGFSEAGRRIAQLSAWEKELKEYGDLNPSDVRAYLDELIESRQSAEQLKRQLEELKEERKRFDTESQNKTKVQDEAKLTKEEKEAVEWLKEKLPNLGYISKDEAMKLINDLQEKTGRIDKLEQYVNTQQEQYRRSLIDDSRTKLKSWMGEDKFNDDEEGSLRVVIESAIKDWIDSDATGRRPQRFYAGGSTKDELIREGYDKAKKALGLIRTTSNSNYVKSKADALKRNGKKLPTQDIVKKTKNLGKSQKRVNSSGQRDFIGEKHNEAWDKFQSIVNRNEEG